MKLLRNMLFLGGVIGFMLVSSSPIFAEVRLQILATSDEAKAEAVAATLDSLGAGPAEVRQADGLYKVLTKPYASTAEANFAKPALRGAGYLDVFAVQTGTSQRSVRGGSPFGQSVPSIVTQTAFSQIRDEYTLTITTRSTSDTLTSATRMLDNQVIPEQMLFDKAMGYRDHNDAGEAVDAFQVFIARFPNSEKTARAKLMRAYWLLVMQNDEAARDQFAAVKAEYPSQTEAGEAELRLGYLQIRANEHGDALRIFHGIASGNVVSTPDVRAEAMLRTAALFHRGKDHEKADACYAVIESAIEDPDAKAFAAMQRTALTLERAWNGSATFEQARTAGQAMLTKYPAAPRFVRATTSLMVVETYCYEGRFQDALQLESSTLNETSGTKEAALAYYWMAKARFETGDTDGALQILEPLMEAELASEERFNDVRVTQQARRLAIRAYERIGNHDRANELNSELTH